MNKELTRHELAAEGKRPVARRMSCDSHSILGWVDGSVTTGMGFYFARRLPVEAMWMVMGEVELYDGSEVKTLCQVARKLAKRGKLTLTALRTEVAKILKVG